MLVTAHLLEGRKDALAVGRGDADPGVADGDAQVDSVVAAGNGLGTDDDFTLWGEFDGVGEQVEQDLANDYRVEHDHGRQVCHLQAQG